MNADLLSWLSPAQASRELGVTPNRVRQLIVERKLRCVMTANGRLVDPSSIRDLKALRNDSKGEASDVAVT